MKKNGAPRTITLGFGSDEVKISLSEKLAGNKELVSFMRSQLMREVNPPAPGKHKMTGSSDQVPEKLFNNRKLKNHQVYPITPTENTGKEKFRLAIVESTRGSFEVVYLPPNN